MFITATVILHYTGVFFKCKDSASVILSSVRKCNFECKDNKICNIKVKLNKMRGRYYLLSAKISGLAAHF